jgi:hypothetical protein
VDLSAHDSQKWAPLLKSSLDLFPASEQPTPCLVRERQIQRHLDQAGQAKVVEAYQQGKTMNDVARQFGLQLPHGRLQTQKTAPKDGLKRCCLHTTWS